MEETEQQKFRNFMVVIAIILFIYMINILFFSNPTNGYKPSIQKVQPQEISKLPELSVYNDIDIVIEEIVYNRIKTGIVFQFKVNKTVSINPEEIYIEYQINGNKYKIPQNEILSYFADNQDIWEKGSYINPMMKIDQRGAVTDVVVYNLLPDPIIVHRLAKSNN